MYMHEKRIHMPLKLDSDPCLWFASVIITVRSIFPERQVSSHTHWVLWLVTLTGTATLTSHEVPSNPVAHTVAAKQRH